MNPTRKICKGCGEDKSLEEYYDQPKGKYGKNSRCKACFSKYRRARYRNSGDVERRKNEVWRKNNLERDRAAKRRYSQTPRGIYSSLKHSCANNEHRRPLKITLEDFLDWWEFIPKTCEYCGLTGKQSQQIFGGRIKRLTIDRVDNSKDYEKDNIALACAKCNYIKGAFFSYWEMIEIGQIIKRKYNDITGVETHDD